MLVFGHLFLAASTNKSLAPDEKNFKSWSETYVECRDRMGYLYGNISLNEDSDTLCGRLYDIRSNTPETWLGVARQVFLTKDRGQAWEMVTVILIFTVNESNDYSLEIVYMLFLTWITHGKERHDFTCFWSKLNSMHLSKFMPNITQNSCNVSFTCNTCTYLDKFATLYKNKQISKMALILNLWHKSFIQLFDSKKDTYCII